MPSATAAGNSVEATSLWFWPVWPAWRIAPAPAFQPPRTSSDRDGSEAGESLSVPSSFLVTDQADSPGPPRASAEPEATLGAVRALPVAASATE